MTESHFHLAGRVQGVFFRVTVKQWADELSLTGFVRNLPDGSLEIVAQGEPAALEELKQRCYNGPERAVVEELTARERPPSKHYDAFTII